MKQKAYHVLFPATLVLVIVSFLFTIFFATVNISFAASDSKKAPAIAKTSAAEHAEAQIKQLKGALDITGAQQELWNNLTAVMRENAKDMDALNKDRAESTKHMNAVEHMKLQSQVTEAHLGQINKLIPPFEAFYSSMSDEQKVTIDTTFRTGKYMKRHGKHIKK